LGGSRSTKKSPALFETLQQLGSGPAGSHAGEYVSAPVMDINGTNDSANTKIAWWISDEGVVPS